MSGEMMNFPDTAEEFMEQYKIVDSEEVYTNGAELVPIFRMKQWFEQHPEPHWIPVEQDTPTEDDDYWCTFGVETGWFVDWCSWYQGRWVVWTDNTVSEVRNVIAWCKPMEPYKGVTE